MSIPILLRDSEVRIWAGSTEPASALALVSEFRINSAKNQWQTVELADGSKVQVNRGTRIELTIGMTLRFDATLISFINTEEDLNLRVSWKNSDGNNARIANLLCEDGKISNVEMDMIEDGFARIRLNYFSDDFTMALG